MRDHTDTYVVAFIAGCLLSLATCGCEASASITEPDPDELRGWASVQVALAGENAVPSAPDEPKPNPGDVCPQCNGTGKTGDGIADCGLCDGTGKVKSTPMPQRQSHQSFPGGEFREDENWEPERRVLWRPAEGERREGEFYDAIKGNYWRPLPTPAQAGEREERMPNTGDQGGGRRLFRGRLLDRFRG